MMIFTKGPRMRRNGIILLPLLFNFFSSLGQESISLYLTSKGEITKEHKADCKCDSEFDVQNFRLNGIVSCAYLDGKPRMKVQYKNGVKNGPCDFYFRNGNKQASGQYINNVRAGIWYFYYPSGQLKQTVKFVDDVYTRQFDNNIMVGEFYLQNGKQLIKNGNGKWRNDSLYISFYERVTLKYLEGEFKDSLKHGEWTLRKADTGKPIESEKFSSGKFVNGKIYYEDNTTSGKPLSEIIQKLPDPYKKLLGNIEGFNLDSTVFADSIKYLDVDKMLEIITGRKFEIQNRDAGYLHGDYELMEYISKNIRYPAEARSLHRQGTVIVQVTIGVDSKAKNIKVIKGIYPSLDDEALRIVNSINQWLCALHQGKPYEKTIGIPIRFAID